MACSCGRVDFARDVGRALLGRRLASLGSMGRCVFANIIQLVECPGNYGPHSELFFFLIKKKPVALTKAVPFNPFGSAKTLKTCALIGLHLLAAECEAGSSGSQSPDLGHMWRYGCPKRLG